MRTRNSMLLVAAVALAVGALPATPAQAESVVRYGISMADIPLTTGQPVLSDIAARLPSISTPRSKVRTLSNRR